MIYSAERVCDMSKISSILAIILASSLNFAASKPRANLKKVNLIGNSPTRKKIKKDLSGGTVRSLTNFRKNLETQDLFCTDSDEMVDINKMSGISNRTKLKNNLKTHEKNVTDSADWGELAKGVAVMLGTITGVVVGGAVVGACIITPVVYYFVQKHELKPLTVWDLMIRLCRAEVCVKKYIETHPDNNQFENQFWKVLVGNGPSGKLKQLQKICSCENIEEMLNNLCDLNLIQEVIKCPPNIEAVEKFLRDAGALKG